MAGSPGSHGSNVTSLAATTHGHIRLLNHILVEKQLCPVTGDHFMAAARSGYPEVIAFLYSLESAGVKDPVQELAHAACYGNLAIMDWIRDNQMEALLESRDMQHRNDERCTAWASCSITLAA
ncbi:hypothetical protein BSLG_004220 [Batrachochytrium salamandrivorans]|nr:hypothetical protein BSLG_004220 [Batrachochytrium salamandrivorans]